jgi:hypothetical protein
VSSRTSIVVVSAKKEQREGNSLDVSEIKEERREQLISGSMMLSPEISVERVVLSSHINTS